jgi:hypothetical protein
MKFTLNTHRDTPLERLVIAGFTKATKDEQDQILSKKTEGDDGYSIYEVKMQVNGVEVDPLDFVERWQDNVDVAIREKAQEMIDDRFREKFNELDDTLDECRNKVMEQFQLGDEE